MRAGSPIPLASSTRRPTRGFTLVEMLVVMAIIAVLLAFIVPAFSQVNTARQMTVAAYNIAGSLETARAYAKANDTYTWVGFYEENASGAAGSAGTGRAIVSVVASKDATALYSSIDPNPPALSASSLVQIGKLTKIDNVHLTVLAPGEVPARGEVTDSSGVQTNVATSYQVGDTNPASADNFTNRSSVTNQTTFSYPITNTSPTYTFVKIIQFNPLGDATKIVDSPTPLIEIGLRPSRGGTVDAASKDCVAIQVSGIGGLVRIYQP